MRKRSSDYSLPSVTQLLVSRVRTESPGVMAHTVKLLSSARCMKLFDLGALSFLVSRDVSLWSALISLCVTGPTYKSGLSISVTAQIHGMIPIYSLRVLEATLCA